MCDRRPRDSDRGTHGKLKAAGPLWAISVPGHTPLRGTHVPADMGGGSSRPRGEGPGRAVGRHASRNGPGPEGACSSSNRGFFGDPPGEGRGGDLPIPTPRAHHHSLTHGATTRPEFLVGVLVHLLAADVRLVHSPVQHEVGGVHPRLPDAAQHEPRGRLSHPQVTMQLHRGHTFEVRGAQVQSDHPPTHRLNRSGFFGGSDGYPVSWSRDI